MKNSIAILLFLLSGCVVEVSDPTTDSTSRDNVSDEELVFYQDTDEGSDDSCAPSYEIVQMPNGSSKTIIIPSLCNDHYLDQGDPQPDQEIDSNDVLEINSLPNVEY